MSASLSKLDLERSSWLTSAGQEDTTRVLAAMKGTPADIATLEHAIAKESALTKPRAGRLKPMEAKLRKFKATAPAPVLTKAALPAIKAAILKRHGSMEEINRKAQDEALPHALCIGLRCFQAHVLFAQKDPGKRGQGRKSGITSTADEISKGGFEGWLAKLNEENPNTLSKGSAYRAMNAFRGLGLDETADEQLVEDTLTDQRRIAKANGLPAPSLKSLADAATQAVAPPTLPPPPDEQLTFDDWKNTLKTFREDSETVIQQIKDMPEDYQKAAKARAYATLYALTGTAWKPSDEHDELGTIDPDNIAI